jgi:(S)-2-hydroxyglutarate dehydrogenase
MPTDFDIAIIGAGIVGLATGLALTQEEPRLRVAILEKERDVATHQSGHNSGVIHSGIYYQPGSLKARLCVQGAAQMIAFCARHGVAVQAIGKVIVATRQEQIPRLSELHRRAQANGVRAAWLDAAALGRLEPNAAGVAALHCPDTSIVDYREVSAVMRRLLQERGAPIRLCTRFQGIHTPAGHAGALRLETDRGDLTAKRVINCAGLYSDMVARLMGLQPDIQIIPFRGEYYFIKPERGDLVHGLIYPVPDPDLPFLGVHFTRTVHGEVEAGPNAVLAFAREGYTMSDVNYQELAQTLWFGGFWRMARRFWHTGCTEFWRSLNKGAFVTALQELVPAVRGEDLVRGGAGVRAQAVDGQGRLVQDFRFLATPRSLHVLNAPSPAATASLAIGEYIVAEARRAWGGVN